MFGWNEPVGRLGFVLIQIFTTLAAVVLGYVRTAAPQMKAAVPEDSGLLFELAFSVFSLVASVLMPVLVFVSVGRRLKDLGVTRWLTPIFFVAVSLLPILLTGVISGVLQGPGYLAASGVVALLCLVLLLIPGRAPDQPFITAGLT